MEVSAENSVYGVKVQAESDNELLDVLFSSNPIPLPNVGETIELRGSSSMVEMDDLDEIDDGTEVVSKGRFIVETRHFDYNGMGADDLDGINNDTLAAVVTLFVSPRE